MNVVLLVAAKACRGQVNLPFGDFPVASAAVQPEMGAIKAVIGLTVVVEAPESPAIGVVTQLAIDAQTTFVNVFGLMTADAFQDRVSVFPRQVALFARGRRMQPDERKTCKVMVEEDFGAPTRLVVTAVA